MILASRDEGAPNRFNGHEETLYDDDEEEEKVKNEKEEKKLTWKERRVHI